MKVLVVPTWYPTVSHPLNGTFVREQTLLMGSLHDVRVLYPNLVGRLQRAKNMLRGRIYDPRLQRMLTPPDGEDVFISNLSSFPAGLDFYRAVERLDKALLHLIAGGWRPDLLHAHVTEWAGAYAVELGRRHGIPVLITEHRGPFTLPKRKPDAERIKAALESGAAVATVSEHESSAISAQGICCSPVVVGNFVDDELFTVRPPVDDGSATILIVSDGSPNKDIGTFLKAFALATRRFGNRVVRATIVSLAPLPDSVLNDARELGIADRCRFLTSVPRSEMPNVYAGCDLIVSTSITESFGISIAEAIACGKPAICTRSGGPEDFVNDSNGYLVNVKDSAAIADRLRDLMENGFHNTPEEIRRSVVDRYGRIPFLERLDRLYEMAIANFERHHS